MNEKTRAWRAFVQDIKVAERTGLEPATSGVTGQHSNQLNYRSTFFSASCAIRYSHRSDPISRA